MLGISKDSYLVVVDPSQYKESDGINNSTDVRPAAMDSNSSLTPLLWSSPLLDLGTILTIHFKPISKSHYLHYSLG